MKLPMARCDCKQWAQPALSSLVTKPVKKQQIDNTLASIDEQANLQLYGTVYNSVL